MLILFMFIFLFGLFGGTWQGRRDRFSFAVLLLPLLIPTVLTFCAPLFLLLLPYIVIPVILGSAAGQAYKLWIVSLHSTNPQRGKSPDQIEQIELGEATTIKLAVNPVGAPTRSERVSRSVAGVLVFCLAWYLGRFVFPVVVVSLTSLGFPTDFTVSIIEYLFFIGLPVFPIAGAVWG